jgi:hypothetical protein
VSEALRETFVTAPEVAEITGAPLHAVYSRTRLARQQFRSWIRAELEPGSERHEG